MLCPNCDDKVSVDAILKSHKVVRQCARCSVSFLEVPRELLGSVFDDRTANSFRHPTFPVFFLLSTPQKLVVEAMRVEEFPPPPGELVSV